MAYRSVDVLTADRHQSGGPDHVTVSSCSPRMDVTLIKAVPQQRVARWVGQLQLHGPNAAQLHTEPRTLSERLVLWRLRR